MICRECKSEYEPLPREASRLYHAHRDGYCSTICKDVAGKRYDEYVDPTGFYRNKNFELD